MKVRAIQFSPILGDISKNLTFHLKEINQAIDDKIELIIFPELSISGYQLKDIIYDISLKPNDQTIKQLADLSKQIDIIIGAPYESLAGIITNTAFYFSEGALKHCHDKVQLPNFGMFEELKIFKPGVQFKTFKIKEFTAGILICREILFPIHAYLYYLQEVDFLIGISNSPHRGITKDGFSSFKFWENLGYVFSVNFHQNYVFVNRCGFEDGIGFGGGSFFAPSGKGIQKKAKYMDNDILDFEISLADVRRSRLSSNYLRDEKPEIILKELHRILNA